MALAGVEVGGDGCGHVYLMPPTCPHMHAHTCTCTHMCNTKIYMYRNCKWSLLWRHPCLSCLTCICVHMHVHACMMHVCMYVESQPSRHPPTQISRNSTSLEGIKMFQFCLKIGHLWRLLHLWVGVWFGG